MNADDGDSPDRGPSRTPVKASAPRATLPIVGIGASAGGLEALSQLLSCLPASTGMAFIVIQHLDPNHESKLGELLSKATRMQVSEATDGTEVRADHVYIIPHNADLAIAQGVLQLSARQSRGPHHPIDRFFHSLAHDKQAGAVGVVLSGTGSDGTLGLAEIKAAGGITFAQNPASAKCGGMPQSAIASGSVDFTLSPDELARELLRLGLEAHEPEREETARSRAPALADGTLAPILDLLRTTFGVDLGQYRSTTVSRRIARRMILRRVEKAEEYLAVLVGERAELDALYQDILINVTSFFRDADLFEALKTSVLPTILEDKSPETAIRVWTAGCSTGQEAYSLAIALLEFLDDKRLSPPIQIFATDLSDVVSLEKARAGLYPQDIEAEVSPERLRRFFKKEERGYRIQKSVRELCVFAKHNLIADPPFSRLDLITCRNVLIYLAPAMQKRVIPTFHYALNPKGFLVMGSSETIGAFDDLFELVDRKHTIYAKNATSIRHYPHVSTHVQQAMAAGPAGNAQDALTPADWQREADRVILGRFAPAGVLVDEHLNILQFRGRTGPYLDPHPGEASLSLLKMVREGLFLKLKEAVDEAKSADRAVHRQGVRTLEDATVRDVDIEVIPIRIAPSRERCFLVLFEEQGTRARQRDAPTGTTRTWFGRLLRRTPANERGTASSDGRGGDELRQELAATREYLQSIIEQRDTTNEELKSANQEILSSNEELQSTNEELETAQEELQSMNEELATLNEQLQHRNLELNQTNNDLNNLLGSSNVPVLMVGCDLRIRRFNAVAGKVLNLLATDVGRPIGQIKPQLDLPDLEQLVSTVVETVQAAEREVKDRDDRWYLLRVHPYRTADDRIDGAVVVLLDIHDLRCTQEELRRSSRYAEAIVETVREPVVVLDARLCVKTANRSFYKTFETTREVTEGRLFYELGNGQWNIPKLKSLLEEVLPAHKVMSDFEVDIGLPLGKRTVVLNAHRLRARDEDPEALILLAIEDVTDYRRKEQALAEADRHKNEFLAMLAHELRNPLGAITSAVGLQRLPGVDAKKIDWSREVVQRQVDHMARMIDDLLDVSRISEGKIELRPEPLDLGTSIGQWVEVVQPLITRCKHTLTVSLKPERITLVADPTRLEQIVGNLLTNAAKYTPSGGNIWLEATLSAGWVSISVRDTGVGLVPEMLLRLFQPFVQAERSLDRAQGGLGLGLTLVRKLTELHGGTVAAFSEGKGKGSVFTVRLPAAAAVSARVLPTDRRGRVLQKGMRVLVVDDSEDTAKATAMLLEIHGYHASVAHDGHAALEAARRLRPDAVILDIGLPRIDGYGVAAELRKERAFESTLLIAVSGYGREQDKALARESGFDHHLTKPVDPGALLALFSDSGSEASSNAGQT